MARTCRHLASSSATLLAYITMHLLSVVVIRIHITCAYYIGSFPKKHNYRERLRTYMSSGGIIGAEVVFQLCTFE